MTRRDDGAKGTKLERRYSTGVNNKRRDVRAMLSKETPRDRSEWGSVRCWNIYLSESRCVHTNEFVRYVQHFLSEIMVLFVTTNICRPFFFPHLFSREIYYIFIDSRGVNTNNAGS